MNKKILLRVLLILLVGVTASYGADIGQKVDKLMDFLWNGWVKGIATLLIAVAGAYLMNNKVEQGKSYALGVVIGVIVIYSAAEIADALT